MRDIKFRAWDRATQKMYQVQEMELQETCRHVVVEGYDCALVDPILLQYTGLRDKNGKEIYEGDIVKYTFDSPSSVYASESGLKVRIHKVFWSDWRSSFAIGNQWANNNLFNYVRNGNRVEVIGNVYENKELLEEE